MTEEKDKKIDPVKSPSKTGSADRNLTGQGKVEQTTTPRPVGKKKTFSFVGGDKRKRGGRKRPFERPKQEFEQTIIDIRRVARVMAGGRRFSFSVAMVVGDKKGRVGVGVGKAPDTALAIEKAARQAKKNIIKVPITKTRSISREVSAKYSSAKIIMKPVPERGLSAGSSVRNVLDLAGITDVSAKVLSRSKNKINNARAAIMALSKLAA